MGWFHYRGRGVRVNKVEAAQWFARAALAGDAGAQMQLGAMLAQGDGVPADAALARQWWERAAAAGNAGPGKERLLFLTPGHARVD